MFEFVEETFASGHANVEIQSWGCLRLTSLRMLEALFPINHQLGFHFF